MHNNEVFFKLIFVIRLLKKYGKDIFLNFKYFKRNVCWRGHGQGVGYFEGAKIPYLQLKILLYFLNNYF